jgi:exodeoxyribonuclease V alpha subunit
LSSGTSSRTVSVEELASAEREISSFMKKGIILDDIQKNAVVSAFSNRLTVITGSAGSGKSAICRCICDIAKGKALSIRQMTPTGKAAKVLQSKTSEVAQTIHRSLGLAPGLDNVEPNPICEDMVIVDEFSMCGLDTVHAIFRALDGNEGVNLVLVGDHQQLPSVSPGSFLLDIIKSKTASIVRLDKIYRQDEKSYITVVADGIAKGIKAEIPVDAEDIKLRPIEDSSQVPAMVCEIISRSMSDKGIPLDDIHAMASMYRGDCGVDAINSAVQEMVAGMNGHPQFIATQFRRFYVGDRVMHCENDYEKNVFNGDMGAVVEVGHRVFDKDKSTVPEPFVVVRYDEERPFVCYRRDDFDTVKVAWCTTVHKYQGSQCKYIVFVAPRAHKFMLSKELVYTAITRAEKKVIILGNQSEMDFCVKKSIAGTRHTTLIQQIEVVRQESPIPSGNKNPEGDSNGDS